MNAEKDLVEIKITKEEAKEVLIKWIAEQGFKRRVEFWESHHNSDGRWSFGLFNPYGAFIVGTNGKVEDNQNYFSGENAHKHKK